MLECLTHIVKQGLWEFLQQKTDFSFLMHFFPFYCPSL